MRLFMKKFNEIKNEAKACLVISTVLSIFYFGFSYYTGNYGEIDNPYPTFLRVFSLIFIFAFIYSFSKLSTLLHFINGLALTVAIIFNPVYPIYLNEWEHWTLLLICGIVMLFITSWIFWFYMRDRKDKNDLHKM